MRLLVPGDVSLELLPPVVGIVLGSRGASATRMAMPEAAIDKHDRPVACHHYVRLSRQAAYVEPIAIARPVHQRTHPQFRRRVLASDSTHNPPAILWRFSRHVPHDYEFGPNSPETEYDLE